MERPIGVEDGKGFLMAWLAEVVKAIAFPAPGGAQPTALALWSKLMGREPDTLQKPRNTPPGTTIAAGAFGDYTVTAIVQLGRIEVAVGMTDTELNAPVPPPNIKDVADAFSKCKDFGLKIAEEFPLSRFAVAVQLVKEIDDPVKAASEINKLLKRELFDIGFLDPLYQINARRKAEAVDVNLNRLCKWGVGRQQASLYVADASGTPVPAGPQVIKDVLFLHLDFNNVPVAEPIFGAKSKALVEEIWADILKVTDNGIDGLASSK